MPETELERLFARFRKIEALFARAGTAGERDAAEGALERIRARMRELERIEQPVELRFSLPDAWARELFVALLRRYGLKPYRYRNQRRTTVMVKVTKTFAGETLWPEFRELHATLREHLDATTRHRRGDPRGFPRRRGATVRRRRSSPRRTRMIDIDARSDQEASDRRNGRVNS